MQSVSVFLYMDNLQIDHLNKIYLYSNYHAFWMIVSHFNCSFKFIMWHKNIPVKTEQILCLQAWEYVQVAHGSSHFLKPNAVKILIFCNKKLPIQIKGSFVSLHVRFRGMHGSWRVTNILGTLEHPER